MMDAIQLPIIAAIAGLIVGPLLGVLVDRAVERLRPAPEHRCTACRTGLGRSSLIPVRSWRDHCPRCGSHKGVRYPLVDVATATVWGLLAWRFEPGWLLACYLAFGAVLVVLSAIDIETHLLPNNIVWPSFFAALFAVLFVSGLLDYADGIASALLGAAVFTGFIGAAHLAHERGMGRGDVKLSMTLGLFIGWLQPGLVDTTRLVLVTILLALVGGGVVGLIHNAVRRRMRAEIPFGPALAVATIVVVVASTAVPVS